MRFGRYNKFVFIGIVYLLLLAGFAATWNMWLTNYRTLVPSIAGAFIVVGAVIFAYWLIDREILVKELRRGARTISTLRIIRNLLLLWIYHYALALSGHNELREDYLSNRLVNRRLEDDIELLRYIFGVNASESNGNIALENNLDPDKTIANYTFSVKTVSGSLDYGLRNMEEIERQISKFPGFLRVGDIEIEKVMRLSNHIRERIIELKEWENDYGKEHGFKINSSTSNLTIRSNLKSIGANTLEVVEEIDANLEKFRVESNS